MPNFHSNLILCALKIMLKKHIPYYYLNSFYHILGRGFGLITINVKCKDFGVFKLIIYLTSNLIKHVKFLKIGNCHLLFEPTNPL